MSLTDIAGVKGLMSERSGRFALTGVRVVVPGPEPPRRSVAGSQHQDREQRCCDSLEPRSGQQHPPVESLRRGGLKRGERTLFARSRVRFVFVSARGNAKIISLSYRNKRTRGVITTRETLVSPPRVRRLKYVVLRLAPRISRSEF